ncbi:MAG TPA: DUF4149 domain-containing protein [Pyrinomonadaceae bacterium]|nr:DUF4149 domain-containing protein [Pyrinomonadaceae bacterium]
MSIEIKEDARAAEAEVVSTRHGPETRAIAPALVAAVVDMRLLLIALWLGAAVFFSSVVAPVAFAVLRSFHLTNANEIAGTIVSRTLAVVNTGGFLVGTLLTLSAFLFRSTARRRGALRAEVISLALVTILCGVGSGSSRRGCWPCAPLWEGPLTRWRRTTPCAQLLIACMAIRSPRSGWQCLPVRSRYC